MIRTRTRSLTILFALLLALAIPASALAVEDSATTPEDLTILATIELTGAPAAVSYGSVTPGTLASGPAATLSVTSTAPGGAHVDVSATDFTSGGNAIGASNRTFTVATPTGGATIAGGAYPGPANNKFTLFSKTSAGTFGATVTPKVLPPGSTIPGSYTGGLTWFATSNGGS